MRLLIVSGIFHPDVGGPATYLYELAHALARAGDDVAVLTYGDPDPPGRYPFKVWRVSRNGSTSARLARFTRTLLGVSGTYPLWYVNDYGIPALIAAAVRRPRIVMKVVGDFAWEYARRNHLTSDGIDAFQRRQYGGRIALLKRIQSLYVRRASYVIVPSVYLAGLVRGWGVGPERVRVIRNAVKPAPPAAVGSERTREPAILFTAARLAPWKGMDHLLHVLACLAQTRPDVQLVVAGNGPEGPRLQTLVRALQLESRVQWLGDVQRECVLHWMRRASLFVLLSEYEGLSHVLLEAMSERLPIVASTAGGNPEVVIDGQTGILVEPADHVGTAARLQQLLNDDARRRAMADLAYTRLADFSWERLLTDTRAVLADAEPKVQR